MRAALALGASCAALPAAAHHEVTAVATTLGMLPVLAMLAAGAALLWHRWRGK